MCTSSGFLPIDPIAAAYPSYMLKKLFQVLALRQRDYNAGHIPIRGVFVITNDVAFWERE